MPGNTGWPDIKVNLKNVVALGSYVLQISDKYLQLPIPVPHDTTYLVYGSRGVPHEIIIYAINGNVSTDTLFISDIDQENIDYNFKGVENNRLVFESIRKRIPNAYSDNAEDTENNNSFSSQTKILIGVSMVALAALIVWYILRRKKVQTNNPK